MKSRLKSTFKTFNEERGAAFLMVLILLMLGGLMLPPLLGLIGTSLATGKMYENKSYELYAADAGVMDAMWVLQRIETPEDIEAMFGEGKYTYTLPETVNGKTVEYEIVMYGAGYKIKSIATGTDGSSTTIETYVQNPQEPDLLYFVAAALDGNLKINSNLGTESERVNIYANGDIDISGSSVVYGDAYYTDGHQVNVGNVIFEGETILTPELRLAPSAIPAKPEDTVIGNMNIGSNTELGPVYIDGDLKITGGVVTLTGTVWVSGDISIGGNSVVNGTDPDGKLYFLISDYSAGGDAIQITGGWPSGYDYKVEAVLYAPDGSIYVGGNSSMNGSAIGKSVSLLGNSNLSNPLPFEEVPVGYYRMETNYWKIY